MKTDITADPHLNDIRIHVTPSGQKVKQVYSACEGCGKARWVALKQGLPERTHCHACGTKLSWQDMAIRGKRQEGLLESWDNKNRRDNLSKRYSGSGNPFYGKKHNAKVLAIISKPRTKIKIKPTTDWGYLIGLVLGDGWLNARNGSYRVGVSSTRSEIVQQYYNVCEELGIHSSYYSIGSFYCSEVCAKALYEYLRPCKYEDFHFMIPSMVYKSRRMACGFLQGFFDADGGVYKTNGGNTAVSIQCWSKHIENLCQVRDLLNIVGIKSYLHKEKKKLISARLCISDYENRCLFRSLVGFKIERKQKRLDNMGEPFGKNYTIEQYEWAMKLKDEGYSARQIEKLTGVNHGTVGVWYHYRDTGHMIRAERKRRKITENDKEINQPYPSYTD